ncbi:hypothetical protein TSUD_23300 [Trifolium subterraneum]|uniref:Uncharacterized protein n=1 Tax=Trifolium subterraneum TaxID=3900 RepID=A0A2Z6M2A8_TRISU|nr:hypothetical protein TSUD_23300 [Trifolium subterraneum]
MGSSDAFLPSTTLNFIFEACIELMISINYFKRHFDNLIVEIAKTCVVNTDAIQKLWQSDG